MDRSTRRKPPAAAGDHRPARRTCRRHRKAAGGRVARAALLSAALLLLVAVAAAQPPGAAPPEDALRWRPAIVRPAPPTPLEPLPAADGFSRPPMPAADEAATVHLPNEVAPAVDGAVDGAVDPAAPAARERAADGEETLSALLTALLLDALPHEYEDTRRWGLTKEVWRGIRLSGDLDDLKLNSRRQRVNHGQWEMYRVRLVDPRERFRVEVQRFAVRDGRLVLDLVVTARLHTFARLAEWRQGVQLWSLSADALAAARLRITSETAVRLTRRGWWPGVAFEPRVTAAAVDLAEFRVVRISKFEGPLVQEIGRMARGRLERELAARGEELAEKMNARIEKQRDRLQFSLDEAVGSAWAALSARSAAPPAAEVP